MKKSIFLYLFLILGIILLNGCSLTSTIKPEEYEEYLINKYGKDEGFELVGEGTCNWFELGYCSYVFSAKSLGDKTIEVSGTFGANGKEFEDNYIYTKYYDQLKEEYNIYFSNILYQNFEIHSIIIDDIYNIPLISYDEYIQLLNDRKIEISLKPSLKLDSNNKYFHLKIADKSISPSDLEIAKNEVNQFIYNNFNMDKLKQDVEDIVKLNNLNNVSKINFYFNDCEEDDYVISCSETIELYNNN